MTPRLSLDELDLADKIITGDAMFCQKKITEKIVAKGGAYLVPVKKNQKNLLENIETAFKEPVFPLGSPDSGTRKAHGRIEQRLIDILPVEAANIQNDWPTVQQTCRVRRIIQRKKKGQWLPPKEEIVYLITSLSRAEASPQDLLAFNRKHWGIETMHRNKDVFLGEDAYTSRKDAAPHNIFILNNLVLAVLKSVSASPTKALEYFQHDKNRAIRLCS